MSEKSNKSLGLSGSTWGSHLNRDSLNHNCDKKKIKIQERKPLFKQVVPSSSSTPKQLSFSHNTPSHDSLLSKQDSTSKIPTPLSGSRVSLKKRKSGISLGRTKSSDFFNTLGYGEESSSKDEFSTDVKIYSDETGKNYINSSKKSEKQYKSDPLARFESEISMDGDGFSDFLTLDSSQTPNINKNQNSNLQAARPLSFLGAINSSSLGSGKSTSFSLSYKDHASSIGISSRQNETSSEKCGLGDISDDELNKSVTSYNTNDSKRFRSESPDHVTNSETPDTSSQQLQSKRLRLSDEMNSSLVGTDIIKPSSFFGEGMRFEDSCSNRVDVMKKHRSDDALDKDNWENVEKRLLSRIPSGQENNCITDVYTLGFEEEEDVSNAKTAAAAGRTALLPLHDASNISSNSVQNLQRERLLQKVQSGKANENYQRINLKKKVFVRGRAGRMTGAKHRRQEWKKKFNEKQKADTKHKLSCNTKLKADTKSSNRLNSSKEISSKSKDENNVKKGNKVQIKHMKGDIAQTSQDKEMKNLKFCDDSCETEKEADEYQPSTRKKAETVKSKNSKTGKKLTKKGVKSKNSNVQLTKTQKDIANNKLNSEQDVWGDDDVDSELLKCFDENGEVKSISIHENNQQTNFAALGIGTKVEPYYSSDSYYNRQEVLSVLQNKFGHSEFRPGQEESIRRILCGHSTLVQLATGSGKSLVYQLPAYLYAEKQYCVTLVVSPLVSLMEDQVSDLPGFLNAACFHSSQTARQREKIVEQIKDAAINKSQRLHFLLVSPETLAGGGSLFASVLRHLPPIAFVCVDEAHCVSAWSHNFRPTYLRLCRVINERLGVKTLLGLTASAPESTIKDVAQKLSVCSRDGIIRGKLLPTNLKLSVSRGESRGKGKEGDLISLLSSIPFVDFCSIIVYCTRRDTCEKLATLIRTQFQDRDVKLNKTNKNQRSRATSLVAEPYHAGLSAYKRKTVQNQFMSGKLRIVVATVAFGMGIDKSDIRAVIHYNMPSSYESYVQEIGRAGRDGYLARCHLFLDSEGRDLSELKRHIYSNSVDRHIIRKLLTIIFAKSSLNQSQNDKKDIKISEKIPEEFSVELNTAQRRVEIAVPIQKLVEKLDMPEENISTFMCYLEEHEKGWIKLLNPTYATCKIHCYGGHSQLEALCRRDPIVAEALKLSAYATGSKDKTGGTIEFPVIQVASNKGWDSGVVKRELKNLQWTTYDGPNSKYKRSGNLVEFSELALHFEMKTEPSEADLEVILDYLYNRSVAREKAELESLKGLFNAFRKVSFLAGNMPEEQEDGSNISQDQAENKNTGTTDEITIKSNKLKLFVKGYFDNEVSAVENALSNIQKLGDENNASNETSNNIDENVQTQLKSDVRQFVVTHSEHTWTGRAVARIFHGIQSPNFPAKQWGRVRRYWRCHLDVDFPIVCSIATKEVIRLRTGK